jgi:hypothetical protein
MPYRAMALVAASLLFATQAYAAKTKWHGYPGNNTSFRMGAGGGGHARFGGNNAGQNRADHARGGGGGGRGGGGGGR